MIDLDLIRLLDVVQRRGTLAGAAEELGKVPSALSYTVQRYEDELGFSLFRREGRRVRFTEAAHLLYERGLPLLQASIQLEEDARAVAFGMEPRLRIAVESWLSFEALAPALDNLLAEFPNLEVQVFEEALSGTWESLLEGRVDVAVGAPDPKPGVAGIQSEVLAASEAVLVVAPNHPLAKVVTPLTRAQLLEERWVILRDTARAWVPREVLGFDPRKKLLVGSMHDKITAQIAGLGIGYLPRPLIIQALSEGRLVELETESPRPPPKLLVAWRSDSRGQGLHQFIKLLPTVKK